MAVKLTAALADELVLADGYIIRFAAVDPTTGADVSGVKVTNVNIDGDTQGTDGVSPSDSGTLIAGPYMLVGGPDA